jgi:16S rRNA (cytosine1402-N4)-methyltransferase
MEPTHIPVLLKEVIQYLDCRSEGCYLDGTLGDGGHAEAILEASAPSGRLLALDQDDEAIGRAKERLLRFGERVIFVRDNFKRIKQVLAQQGMKELAGVVIDLGVSARQVENSRRGFSFRLDGPLDMRQDRRQLVNASRLVNNLSQKELERLIRKYGEERWSARIAKAIVSARSVGEIESTLQLAEIVTQAIPKAYHPRNIHPATRTFQALRIEVNQELEGLDEAISDAVRALAVGRRICIISYHSLEDRIVKHGFKRLSGVCTCPPKLPQCVCGQKAILKLLTSRPIIPTISEQNINPRSRSAKLRVAQRLPLAA